MSQSRNLSALTHLGRFASERGYLCHFLSLNGNEPENTVLELLPYPGVEPDISVEALIALIFRDPDWKKLAAIRWDGISVRHQMLTADKPQVAKLYNPEYARLFRALSDPSADPY